MTKEWRDAVLRRDEEKVQSLLTDGADVNARDRYGQTALMLAARQRSLRLVPLLVKAGAELDTTAKYALSALMLAVVNGHWEVVRVLVAAGAGAGLRGSGAPGFADKTAYDLAVARGEEELARRHGLIP